MPLHNKQPFKPNPIPDNLSPDDEVLYHALTNEVFTNHDAYFDRFLYCASLVWTCARTGKSGLTFEEALNSERAIEANDSETSGPTKRKRANNSSGKKQNKKQKQESPAKIKPDPKDADSASKGEAKLAKKKRTKSNSSDQKKSSSGEKESSSSSSFKDASKTDDQGESLTIMNGNGDANSADPNQPVKKKKKKYPYDPKKYAMPVPEGFDPSLLTPTGKIDGRKLKSKRNTQLAEELLTASGYQPKTPANKPGSGAKKSKAKAEEARKREEEARKKEEEAKKKLQQAELARERELEAKRKKEAAALARQLERQKKEEERKRAAAYLQNWEKKCEDLERDDLRRLPQPTPVNCEIPERLFGDSIYIMEAIYNFHDLYGFNTIYTDGGLNFDTLEEVLLDKQEGGALGVLLQYLLQVIFKTQPTQDGYGLDDDAILLAKTDNTNSKDVKKDQNLDVDEDTNEYDHEGANQNGDGSENNDDEEENDDEHNEKYVNMNDRIGSAIKAAQEVKKSLTKPLPEMEITHQNITEIVRLHLLQSGSFPKGRTIYNGWYSSREDPGLWLCMEEPDLMKKLGEVTVYDLEIEERIKILHTLINQLLTFIKSRSYMEVASDQLLELRKAYRKEAADFARWDRENCVKRMQPPKKKTDQPTSGAGTDEAHGGGDQHQHNQDNVKVDIYDHDNTVIHNGENMETTENGQQQQQQKHPNQNHQTNNNNQNGSDEQTEQSYEEQERAYQQNKVDYDDYQRERAIRHEQLNEILLDIRTQLRNNQSVYAIHPIGRDRAYRRYWLFQSMPGLFVEQDDEYVGACLSTPTPLESRYKKLFGKENPLMHANEADLIRPKTCDVACSTDSNDAQANTKTTPEQTSATTTITKTTNEDQNSAQQNNNGPNTTKDEDHHTSERLNGGESGPGGDGQSSEHDGEQNNHQEPEDIFVLDEMNYCTGDEATCYIHGPKRPTQKWWFYHNPESIDRLIECLNKRGYRECELHDVLSAESSIIKPRVAESPAYKLNKLILEHSGIRRSRRLRTKTGKRRSRRDYD